MELFGGVSEFGKFNDCMCSIQMDVDGEQC
jgi:hypothetical protein